MLITEEFEHAFACLVAVSDILFDLILRLIMLRIRVVCAVVRAISKQLIPVKLHEAYRVEVAELEISREPTVFANVMIAILLKGSDTVSDLFDVVERFVEDLVNIGRLSYVPVELQ